jgi:hypothetical protein
MVFFGFQLVLLFKQRIKLKLPMLWNDVIEDILGLILCEVLIRSKWQELIDIVVESDPPGAKLTD